MSRSYTISNGGPGPSAGPQSLYVTLVSSDGFEFHVRRSAACISGTIRRMLDPSSNFSEASSGICHLEEINGMVLEKVVEYFYYNEKHRDSTGVADMDIPLSCASSYYWRRTTWILKGAS